MKEKKAKEIVDGISFLAEAYAALAINKFCESTDNAIKNTQLIEAAKISLKNLLTN